MKNEPLPSVTTFVLTERRYAHDRRTRRLKNIRWFFLKGRRRRLRRETDRRQIVLLDYYSPRIFYAVILILLLSVVDALLTLWLLDNGAVEMNPVMAYFLNKGTNTFMAVKYLLTTLSVVIVVVLNYVFIQHIRSSVRNLLKYFAGSFAAVVLWELVLVVYVFL